MHRLVVHVMPFYDKCRIIKFASHSVKALAIFDKSHPFAVYILQYSDDLSRDHELLLVWLSLK